MPPKLTSNRRDSMTPATPSILRPVSPEQSDVLQRGGLPVTSEGGLTSDVRLTIYMVLAARRWRSMLDEKLRPLGQSAARMEAMWSIAYTPPLSPQIEIARRIGIEGATLTRMLDTLEAEGLVERQTDPQDRRSKHIRLTDAGKDALADIMAVAHGLRTQMLEGIAPPAIDEANDFLALLLTHFDEGFVAPPAA